MPKKNELHGNDGTVPKVLRRRELLRPALEVPRPVPVAPPFPPIGYGVKKEGGIFQVARRIGAWFALRRKPFWETNLTTLFYGPRSQGKSLHQAKTVRDIFDYLDALYELYPELPHAVVVSNQKFNATIEAKELGRHLFYWENIQQLKFCPRQRCWKGEQQHRLHDCYLIIDDAATIIPADGWQDLPRWFRKIFAQAGHNGVHCLANCQDPASIDINFKRYIDLAFKFHKVAGNRRPEAGKPPVNFIWGLYTSREIPAEELYKFGDMTEAEIQQRELDRQAEESLAKETGRKIARAATNHWKRRYHIVRRRDTEIYDTLQNVPEYMPNSYEHIEMKCINPKCTFKHVRHRVI